MLTTLLRFTFFLAIICLTAACGTNPVTGKQELQFISESAEIQLGTTNYLAMQQASGGEYVADPEIDAYVSEVGQRLAAVSHRPQLPYEFTVINSSVPNAWALPGGKIAINRGLLTELDSEGELAAVLGHEIVHANARHGAKAVERGMLYQVGLMGLGLAVHGKSYANTVVGGAATGLGLLSLKYSRNAELEADKYSINYLVDAGYDPEAAVELQEMFVQLNDGQDQSWLAGLFSTHPPSQDRLEANRKLVAQYPSGGEVGKERYDQVMAHLHKTKPAYEELEKGVEALATGDTQAALRYADAAIALEPNEALFYELKGRALAKQQQTPQALAAFDQAISRNPTYFDFYLQRGLTKWNSGDLQGARPDLEYSVELLPTALGYYSLGQVERISGNQVKAIQSFSLAAQANTDIGNRAKEWLARLDLPQHPEKYLKVELGRDYQGYATIYVQNQSQVGIEQIVVAIEVLDADGRLQTTEMVRFPYPLRHGQTSSRRTGFGPYPTNNDMQQQLQAYIIKAQAVDN